MITVTGSYVFKSNNKGRRPTDIQFYPDRLVVSAGGYQGSGSLKAFFGAIRCITGRHVIDNTDHVSHRVSWSEELTEADFDNPEHLPAAAGSPFQPDIAAVHTQQRRRRGLRRP